MTIKELYEWAIKNDAVDKEIGVMNYDRFQLDITDDSQPHIEDNVVVIN